MSYQEIVDKVVEQSIDKAEKISNYILQKYKEENNPQLNSEPNHSYGNYVSIGIVAIATMTIVAFFKKHNSGTIITALYNDIPVQNIDDKFTEDMSPI